MSVDVLGGAQTFSLGLDLGKFEDDLRSGMQSAISETKKFEKSLLDASGAGRQALTAAFQDAMKTAQEIGPLLEKGLEGIDPKKLEKLNQEIADTEDEFGMLGKTISFIEENLNNLNLNPEEFNQLSAGVEKIKSTFSNLSVEQRTVFSQLRDIKSAMASGQSGPMFEQMKKDAAILGDRLKKVQQEIKLAGSNAPGLLATGEAVKGMVAGFQALQGVLALVSGGNEDVERTTASLIASMSVLHGLSEVMSVLDKNSALNTFLVSKNRQSAAIATTEQAIATNVLTAATTGQAAATTAATVAQTGLNTAMKLNPAALLLTGLTALFGAIAIFGQKTKDATDQVKAFNFELEKISTDANSIVDKLKFITDLNNEQARSRGSVESQISQSNIDGYKKEADAYRASIDQKILSSRKYLASAFNVDTKELTMSGLQSVQTALLNNKLSDKERSVYEREESFLKSVLSDYKSLEKAQQNLQIETVKKVRQSFQEALRSAEGYAEARLIMAKKNTKDELDVEIQAIRARTNAQLNAGNQTSGELAKIRALQEKEISEATHRYNQVILNDEKSFLESRLAAVEEGTIQELDLKIELIKKTAEIELSQIGITEGEKARINAETNSKIYEATRKFNSLLQQEAIEIKVSTINRELSLAVAGSEKELDLKIGLLNEQAKLEIVRIKEQIRNEELLQAKIQEILAASIATQKKYEEDYVRDSLTKRFELIQRQADIENDKFQSVLNSSSSTVGEKYNSQLKILENNLQALKNKQAEVTKELQLGKGNCEELTKSYEDLGREIEKTKRQIDDLNGSKLSNEMKALASDINEVSSAMSQLADSMKDINPALSDTLQTLSDIGSIAGSVLSAIANFASGNIAGGIASSIKVISGILGLGKQARAERERYKEEVESFLTAQFVGEQEINRLYRERALEVVRINKLKIQGLLEEKKLLQEQKVQVASNYETVFKELQNQTARVRKKIGFFEIFSIESLFGKSYDDLEKLFVSGQLEGKAKELFELLRSLKEEGVDIDKQLEENRKAAQELFTGTTEASLSDSIISGFRNGLRSAKDFASTFQELMQNALLQSLQLKYLEAPLKDFFNEFADMAGSDNMLTAGEIEQLRSMYNQIINNAQAQFSQLQQISGLNLSANGASSNSLTGAIKGITEQQAELLAGQFGGLRMTALEALSVSKRQLDALNLIQNNTGFAVVKLASILETYRSWETGLKKIHVQI